MNARRNDFDRPSALTGLVGGIWRGILRGTGQEDLRNDDSNAGTGNLLTLPFRLLWAFAGFLLQNWSTSRSGAAFLAALPAILAGGAFIVAVTVAYTAPFRFGPVAMPDPAARYLGRTLYFEQIINDRSVPDEELARKKLEAPAAITLCAEKLVNMRPTVEDYRFLLGQSRALVKDIEGARDIMESMATTTSKGYSGAHVWLGNYWLATEDSVLPPEQRRQLAFDHLSLVEDSGDDQDSYAGYQSKLTLAKLLIDEKRYDEAQKLLEPMVERKLSNRFQLQALLFLAISYKNAGETAKIERFQISGNEGLKELSLLLPDELAVWETMVKFRVTFEDYEGAASVVRDGILSARKKETKDALVRIQIELVLFESKNIPNLDSKDNYVRKFQILGKALVNDPFAIGVYMEMLPYVDVQRENKNEGDWLREMFLLPDAPTAPLHVVIGVRDMLEGRFSEGQSQWMRASRTNPQSDLMINFFLRGIGEKNPDQAEIIANLTSVAIEIFPTQRQLYLTRAVMMQKMEKYPQAIADLEHVLSEYPENIEILKQIVEAVQKTGDSARAAEYQSRLDQAKQKAEEAQRARENRFQ